MRMLMVFDAVNHFYHGRIVMDTSENLKARLQEATQELQAQSPVPRNATWAECGIEGKLERLRAVLQDLQRQMNHLRNGHDRTTIHFYEHKHLDGSVVLPPDRYGPYGYGKEAMASAHDLLA